jgi:acetyl/propionyl-CoA carboxylase alpha subunit
MLLELTHGEKTMLLELSGDKGIIVDGRKILYDWIQTGHNQYSLIVDGKVFDLMVELSGSGCSVSDRTGTIDLVIKDPRKLRKTQSVEEANFGVRRILAEMPGKVVRLLVKVGNRVSLDQSLLVVEAMKMQNEIRAPRKGVVKEIGVVEGVAVNHGDFLISLE